MGYLRNKKAHCDYSGNNLVDHCIIMVQNRLLGDPIPMHTSISDP